MQQLVCRAKTAPVVPAGSIRGFTYRPTMHVHYGEKVMPVRDGLPKFKDFPKEFGGSGDTVPIATARELVETSEHRVAPETPCWKRVLR